MTIYKPKRIEHYAGADIIQAYPAVSAHGYAQDKVNGLDLGRNSLAHRKVPDRLRIFDTSL